MNKTVNVNLAGIIFYVDEDAYHHFSNYLSAVRKQFSNAEERDEIIADIEARIAELLQQKLSSSKQVVSRADVDEVIAVMGSPEDYKVEDEADAQTSTSNQSSSTGTEYAGPKRLFRNPDDKILGGVSSGMAAYFNIDPLWVRLAWVALFFGFGTGFLLYIILWAVMPEAKTTAQKLQMRGEPININNIEKSVKEEMRDVKERFEKFSKGENLKSNQTRLRNTVEEIVQAILNILKYIFTFAFKFVGGVLMVVGVIVLLALFSVLLGNDFQVNGAYIDWHTVSGYLSAITTSSSQKMLLVSGVIMLALAPIIGLILLGMRILFNYRNKPRFVNAALVTISILGTIFIVMAITTIAVGFSEEATYTETIELGSEHKNFSLRVSEFINDERPHELDWTITDKAQLLHFVNLDVRQTEKTEPYIEMSVLSHGKTRLEARKRAKNFSFYHQQQDSIILLADYFTIPTEERFRGQNMNVVLYLPVGYSVHLDETVIDMLNDVQNVTNTWDGDMVAHTWVMTQNGLACTDCTGNEENWRTKEEWDSYEEQFDGEAKKFEEEARLKEAERKLQEAEAEIERIKKEKTKK